MVTNEKGEIQNVTSGAISLLDLDVKRLNEINYNNNNNNND